MSPTYPITDQPEPVLGETWTDGSGVTWIHVQGGWVTDDIDRWPDCPWPWSVVATWSQPRTLLVEAASPLVEEGQE